MPPLSKKEILSRLARGPFLLCGEGAPPSEEYQVVQTPAGPAVFPTWGTGKTLVLPDKSPGGEAVLRRMLLRVAEEAAHALGLMTSEEARGLWIAGGGKQLLLVVDLSGWVRRHLPRTTPRAVISPVRFRGGYWIPLVPGCDQNIRQVLQLHFLGQPQQQGPSLGRNRAP